MLRIVASKMVITMAFSSVAQQESLNWWKVLIRKLLNSKMPDWLREKKEQLRSWSEVQYEREQLGANKSVRTDRMHKWESSWIVDESKPKGNYSAKAQQNKVTQRANRDFCTPTGTPSQAKMLLDWGCWHHSAASHGMREPILKYTKSTIPLLLKN